jgi:pimeloyl-ACP methyl ester carboxylesterase
MQSHSYPRRILALRTSRRLALRAGLLAASVLTALSLLGCEGEEAEPPAATPQATAVAATPTGIATPATPQDAAVPTFDSDGVTIHYEVFGEGRPIVLVHGFTASLQMNWVLTSWVDTLTPIRQVVALDCRGHGLSDKPHEPGAYAGGEMGEDVIRLMDHLGIEKADLFGYSMGAGISVRLLLDHPDRFTSVVLGGIGEVLTTGRDEGASAIADAMLAEDPETITNPIAKGFRTFADMGDNDHVALAAYLRAAREAVVREKLAEVDLPVLIVNGADDTLVGSPDELAAAIPGAELVLIPDKDHLSVVADERFKQAVVQFLTEVSAGSPAPVR